ncbi:MAG TPA: conjugal transfer protein [Solirubrobacteraceae bacterium]|nr:conjugal transfer protein [Solirubrobacteraceae bacterium]
MSAGEARAHITISRRSLRRLRLTRESGRYAVIAASMFGLLASARFAIAPPRPAMVRSAPGAGAAIDLAAEGFAVRFARGYLSWNDGEPAGGAATLEAFGGGQLEPGLGLEVPPTGEQRVLWAEVVQAREPVPDLHVYTVAAATTREGLRYLTVPVERTATGLALAGYPAFVGAPASAPAVTARSLRGVAQPALELVVRRALANYLSGSTGELAADLVEGARVSPPAVPMRLLSTARQEWAPGGGAVSVVAQARDGLGARYTLSYELDVTRVHGRWEVSAIQTDPYA